MGMGAGKPEEWVDRPSPLVGEAWEGGKPRLTPTCILPHKEGGSKKVHPTGSLTPYLDAYAPTEGEREKGRPRDSLNLHAGVFAPKGRRNHPTLPFGA
jgi:hypothetical protein